MVEARKVLMKIQERVERIRESVIFCLQLKYLRTCCWKEQKERRQRVFWKIKQQLEQKEKRVNKGVQEAMDYSQIWEGH